jgi:hypothetical protein
MQLPNQFIMTFPGAFHEVYNTGLNCAEACNFTTPQWIEQGILDVKCQYNVDKDKDKPEGEGIPALPMCFMFWQVVKNLQVYVAYLHGNLIIPLRDDPTKTVRVPPPRSSAIFKSVEAWNAKMRYSSQEEIHQDEIEALRETRARGKTVMQHMVRILH